MVPTHVASSTRSTPRNFGAHTHTHTHTPCGIGGVYRVFTKLAETPGDDQLGVGNSALPPLRRRRRRRNSKTKKKKERRNETCRRRPLKRRPVREREREKKSADTLAVGFGNGAPTSVRPCFHSLQTATRLRLLLLYSATTTCVVVAVVPSLVKRSSTTSAPIIFPHACIVPTRTPCPNWAGPDAADASVGRSVRVAFPRSKRKPDADFVLFSFFFC